MIYGGHCGGAEQLVGKCRVSPQISGWQSECPIEAISKSSYDLGVRDVQTVPPKKGGCTDLSTHGVQCRGEVFREVGPI